MKKSSLVFLIASCILFAGCRYSSSSGKKLVKPEEEDIEIVEDDEPEMDSRFYVGLLNSFCIEYYDRSDLKGHYVPDSLQVLSVWKKDTHSVVVEGTHKFKGIDWVVGQAEYPNQWFQATVTKSNRTTYIINFCRREVKLGKLGEIIQVGPGDKIYSGDIAFEYNAY